MGQKYSEETIDEFYNKWVTLGWWATGTLIEGFVDPERLIIETTHIGRYEGRLFKAMLTWIRDYYDLINVQRLLHFMGDAEKPILGAAFDIAMQQGGAGD